MLGQLSSLPSYTLRRSIRRRRTIELSVDPTQGLLVTAPARVAKHEIEAFIGRKTEWVARALQQARDRQCYLQREFATGESLPYLGQRLQLTVIRNQPLAGAEQAGESLLLRLPPCTSEQERRIIAIATLQQWYVAKANDLFPERVRWFAPKVGAEPRRIAVRSQKARWGSCGKDGTLFFNWRLMLAPLPVLEYLVVHELCHLRQPGHRKTFSGLVGKVLPDFAAREAELRRDGWKYRIC